MRRIAQTIRLRPERREEYLRLHAAVWPGVEAALRAANFEYWGDDLERDLASIGADPETKRWWELTDPCQEPWPDRGAGGHWSDLTEVWHLSEAPGRS
jgi:L-rhamnose mutarotase